MNMMIHKYLLRHAMYESLGEKYYRVDYSHRDYFFTGLPKGVDKAMEDPW